MIFDWINSYSSCQSEPHTKRIPSTLTVHNQPRQMLSITYDITIRFHLEGVKGVRPVNRLPFLGAGAGLVEQNQIRREAPFVHHPTFDVVGIVDVVILVLFRRDAIELGSSHYGKDGVRHTRQRWVELGLQSPVITTQPAVAIVVLLEVGVRFDRGESRTPFGLPVDGDVEDVLDEDLVVDETRQLRSSRTYSS